MTWFSNIECVLLDINFALIVMLLTAVVALATPRFRFNPRAFHSLCRLPKARRDMVASSVFYPRSGACFTMSSKVVAFASDHAGFELKALLLKDVEDWGYPTLDLGTDSLASVDYPDYGKAMADAIDQGRAWLGVLVCGSGIGISLSLIHISEPTRPSKSSRMPSSA